MPEELFPSVVRSHRAVMRWQQPRSIHLCDEHGCVQLVDAGGAETTRGRVPREISETFEVSPTGSIPHGKTRHGKSPMTRSKPLGPCYPCGHEAPEEKRPLTRGTVEDSQRQTDVEARSPNQKFTGREGAARAARCVTLGLAPPGNEIPPLRGRQKPLQDPTPVERARTVTRMAGVLNHAQD